MKKLMKYLTVGLVGVVFAGCSPQTPEVVADVQESVTIEDYTKDELVAFVANDETMKEISTVSVDELTFFYDDFDQDNLNEVAIYSADYMGFYDIAIVDVMENQLTLIENDMNYSAKYGQSLSFKDPFIVASIETGGTGCKARLDELYVYDGKKIVNSQASLLMTEISSDIDGNVKEITGNLVFDTDENYSDFTYESILESNDQVLAKKHYIYNEEEHKFFIEDLMENE